MSRYWRLSTLLRRSHSATHGPRRGPNPEAGEADVAGPWRVEEVPGGFGVFRAGETAARGFPPYAVTERGGEEVGHLQLFDEKLVDALNVLDALLRTPEALAGVLEAAGAVALERAGVILEERFREVG